MPDRDLSIRLDLHLHDEELSGEAVDDAGARRAFDGWLGLVSAIDALLLPSPPFPPTEP